MKRKKKLSVPLSSQLYDRIYDPTLPETWDINDKAIQLTVANALFLLLSPQFQKKYGELLENELNTEELLESGIITTNQQYRKSVSVKMDKRQDELIEKLYAYSDKWPFNVDLSFLVNLLMGRISMTPQRGSILYSEFDARECMRSIEIWSKLRYKSKFIPDDELYYKFNIGVDKKILLERFEEVIDDYQKDFFKQKPELINPFYGHRPRKKEVKARRQGIDWDVMKKCFQAYVYYQQKQKQREIADLLYKDDTDGIKKIENRISEAKNLIQNAWNNDFPGKYT